MEIGYSKNLKRKNSQDTFDDDVKRIKWFKGDLNLENLSEDVLFIIFSHLDSTSLYSLSLVSTRFKFIAENERFWKKIDVRRKPFNLETVEYCLKQINKSTSQILLAGPKRYDNILSSPLLNHLKLHLTLRVLALENQTIDGAAVKLRDFPKTLEELSLRRSYILSAPIFFGQSFLTMGHLRVLILDHCKWITTEQFLPISRFAKLEILSIYMGKNLMDEMSYISVSTRFGFKNLKILNLRFTGVGDQFLKSLYKHPTLQEIYFQDFHTTFKKSCIKRKLNILNDGLNVDENSYLTDEDIGIDYMISDIFKQPPGCTWQYNTVTRKGVAMYKYTKSSDTEQSVKKSVLYKDQYQECKCGFFERFWDICNDPDSSTKTSASNSEEDIEDSNVNNEKKILEELLRKESDLKLPDVCKYLYEQLVPFGRPNTFDKFFSKDDIDCAIKQEATIENKNYLWWYFRKPLNDFEISMYENLPPQVIKVLEDYGKRIKKELETDDNVEHANGTNQPSICTKKTTNSNGTNCNDDATPGPSCCGNQSVLSINCNAALDVANRRIQRDQLVFVGMPAELLLVSSADLDEKRKTQIKKMSLRGYKTTIDDKCLDSVSHLKLELLDVTDTAVTSEGLKRFMINNPQCRLVHEKACICEPEMHF